MPPKIQTPCLLLLGLLFIGFGDQLLPKPLDDLSLKTRSQITSLVLTAFHRGLQELPRDERAAHSREQLKQVQCQLEQICS
ncbi:MAG: hypothetical protein NW237_15795 [Cyanobacteriota bacterium]|nr:hypothetical protein [Cyanobacteriota bacterium]